MMVTGAAGALIYSDNIVAAVPVGLLGLLLLVQVMLESVLDLIGEYEKHNI